MWSSRRLAYALAAIAVLFGAFVELSRPTLLLVGNVTTDVVEGSKSAGGAVTYAAAVAEAMGARTCIVTAADATADLSSLSRSRMLEVIVVPANRTLTFEHSYTFWGSHRKLRVSAQPGVTLQPSHVPRRCLWRASVILLGPLAPADLDAPAFVAAAHHSWLGWVLRGFRTQHVGLMAQGLQRNLDSRGRVSAPRKPSHVLLDSLGPATSLFLSDVETDVWPNGTVEGLARQTARFLVTRGSAGADEHHAGSLSRHAPYPVETVVDTNGAGDSFATGYMLALAAGHSSPAAVANWAGGLAVTQPQACKPGCVADAIRAARHTMPPSTTSTGSMDAAAALLRQLWAVVHGAEARASS